jgi:carbamoylphosphate synthase large subunit
MQINILMTTIGGKVSPSLIRSLQDAEDFSIKIVGTDSVDNVVGGLFVDKFHKVTSCSKNASKFISDILEIVESDNIDFIIPLADEECLALANEINLVEQLGANVLISKSDGLNKSFDKYHLYSHLRRHIPSVAPEFTLVDSRKSYYEAFNQLGGQNKKLVIKPRQGRGGRGVLVLNPDMNLNEILAIKPGRNYHPLYVDQLINQFDWSEEFLLMEYLPGDVYSAYALCDQGSTLASVAHRRLWGTASNTLKSEFIQDEILRNKIIEVNESFGFDYSINYEFKKSSNGRYVLFDLNPRIAASTAIFRSLGFNFILNSLRLALGKEIKGSITSDDDIVMYRYLKAIFTDRSADVTFEI